MTNANSQVAIQIPLSLADRQLATQFAQRQPTPEKAAQVQQNTLAVLTMYHYLQMLDVSTSLEGSQSWSPIDQLCANVADLMIPGAGRLECRPVSPGDVACPIPPETWGDRLGYVVVCLDSAHQGTVLGFTPQAESAIALNRLRPVDELLPVLQPASLAQRSERSSSGQSRIRLRRWLGELGAALGDELACWQPIEALLSSARPAVAFRAAETAPVFEVQKQAVQQLYRALGQASPEAVRSIQAAGAQEELVPPLVNVLESAADSEVRWRAADLLRDIEPSHPGLGDRRGLDLGLALEGHRLALMVAVLPQPNGGIDVLARVYPLGDALLPPNVELTGLDASDSPFLTVESRARDNYIQIKFAADQGEPFSLRVAIAGASLTQNFVN
ncbi:MAG: DUF1822 family protein [Elainellaceae cyanobacterium]